MRIAFGNLSMTLIFQYEYDTSLEPCKTETEDHEMGFSVLQNATGDCSATPIHPDLTDAVVKVEEVSVADGNLVVKEGFRIKENFLNG